MRMSKEKLTTILNEVLGAVLYDECDPIRIGDFLYSMKDPDNIGFAFDHDHESGECFNFVTYYSRTIKWNDSHVWRNVDGYFFSSTLQISKKEAEEVYKKESEEWKLLERLIEVHLI